MGMVFTGTVEKTHDRCLSMSLSLGSMGKHIGLRRGLEEALEGAIKEMGLIRGLAG